MVNLGNRRHSFVDFMSILEWAILASKASFKLDPLSGFPPLSLSDLLFMLFMLLMRGLGLGFVLG